MTGPRTTRRRWLAGSIAAVAGLAVAGSLASRGQAQWIGEVPLADNFAPDEQVFLSADLDKGVFETLRDLQAEIDQALEDAGVEGAWIGVKPPEYRFDVHDPSETDRALQIVKVAVPDAEFEVAGGEIRARLVDPLLDRIRRDVVLKSANRLRHHARRVFGGPVAEVGGQEPEFKVYAHESGCLRVDIVGRIQWHHVEPYQSHMDLVPLYPTLDAGSDHLPQGFTSLRIAHDREAAMPADERMTTRPADERLPEFRPEEPPLEALKRWKSALEAEPRDRRAERQDRWRYIVGGKPIVTDRHFVNAEIEQRPSGPAVQLRLDVVGGARIARLLPEFAGRQFGLVVDNIVIGRFKTVTKADLGITLVPDVLLIEAEALAGWLNDMVNAADLETIDACPAADQTR